MFKWPRHDATISTSNFVYVKCAESLVNKNDFVEVYKDYTCSSTLVHFKPSTVGEYSSSNHSNMAGG